MKRLFLFSVLVSLLLGLHAQADYNDFVGTWVYARNDTVFKVKLQKGIMKYRSDYGDEYLFGGYSLTVKGIMVDNYMGDIPLEVKVDELPDCGVYIYAYPDPQHPVYAGFTFYDMKKKHLFGEGLPCNVMTLLSSDKLHWKLNEKEGLWFRLEGGLGEDASEEEERRWDEAWKLRGFSVPDDVIMIKEK